MIRTVYLPLTRDERDQMERDARRYQGAWTGTNGTLAAHVIRLIAELERVEAGVGDASSATPGQAVPGHPEA